MRISLAVRRRCGGRSEKRGPCLHQKPPARLYILTSRCRAGLSATGPACKSELHGSPACPIDDPRRALENPASDDGPSRWATLDWAASARSNRPRRSRKVRSNAASDWEGCCGITIAKRPDHHGPSKRLARFLQRCCAPSAENPPPRASSSARGGAGRRRPRACRPRYHQTSKELIPRPGFLTPQRRSQAAIALSSQHQKSLELVMTQPVAQIG